MDMVISCATDLVVQNGNFTLQLTSSGQEWQLADLPADLPPKLTSSGQDWQLADLPADLSPKCIIGYILWDVFGSHLDSSRKGGNFLLFLNN